MTITHIAPSLLPETNTLLNDVLGNNARIVVSDINTLSACGWQGAPDFTHSTHHQFDILPKADQAQADHLVTLFKQHKSAVAIGSGTINDLCKYAAHRANIPYAVIATAPSMNGYTSPNASLLSLDGGKQSYTATAPAALFMDLDVMANAPARLIRSGIGDTLCRSAIETDILLSHALCGTPDYQDSFEAMRACEATLIEQIYAERFDMSSLCHALIASGDAMAQAGSSAPASQSEHMIAHIMEMLDPELSARCFHGEIIAVTSLYCSALQEAVLATQPNEIDPIPFPYDYIEQIFGDTCAHSWKQLYDTKWARLLDTEHPLRIPEPRLNTTTLRTLLTEVGCPTTLDELGVSETIFKNAAYYAAFSRDRLTYLDAALACGLI